MRASLLVLALAPVLALAGCEKDGAQSVSSAPPGGEAANAPLAGTPPAPGSGPQAVESPIDWAAARSRSRQVSGQ